MKFIAPVVVASSLLTTTAFAQDAKEILEKVDAAMNTAKDQFFEYEVLDEPPGKEQRQLGLQVSLKGEKRLTKFTAPADVKGTTVLILTQTQMYVYLPAYKKVRRIASHVTNQGFLGTTYSNDDMALSRFSDKYTGKVLSQDDKTYKIEVNGIPGGEAPYPKIILTIDRTMNVPTVLEYYNAEGKNTKTETRTEYSCESKQCTARVQHMTDHTSSGHNTKLVRTKWKVNSGIEDKLFSKRNLARSR